MKHKHNDPVASLDYAHINKSIISICYNSTKEKHPFTSDPVAKHDKLKVSCIREKPVIFVVVTSATAKTSLGEVPLQKILLLYIYNSLHNTHSLRIHSYFLANTQVLINPQATRLLVRYIIATYTEDMR